MFTIILDRFAEYSPKEIYARLVASGQTAFEIIIPRMNLYDEGCIGYLLAVEYNEAMYCGQLLSGLGSGFTYRVPYKNSLLPFCFNITPHNIEQLAENIFHLASVYKENDTARWDYYETEKNNFCFSCYDNITTPVCSGFLPLISLVLEEEAEDIIKAPEKLPKKTAWSSIRIIEFIGYSRDGLLQYLQLMETKYFCLVLDRFDEEITYDADTIAREFFHAAFVGQQLQAFCKSFSYLVPDPHSTVHFQFNVVTNNLRRLAGLLYEMIRVAAGEKEILDVYYNKIDLFGIGYSEGELEPVCHGLLDVFEDAAERANNNG